MCVCMYVCDAQAEDKALTLKAFARDNWVLENPGFPPPHRGDCDGDLALSSVGTTKGSSNNAAPVPNYTYGGSSSSSTAPVGLEDPTRPAAEPDPPSPAPFKNKDQRIAELIRKTKHVLHQQAIVMSCNQCATKCSIRGVGVEDWRQRECLTATRRTRPDWVHESHQYSCSEPYHYCSVFGSRGTTSRVVKLKDECERRPTAAGQKALAAFLAGRPPP